MKLTKKKEIKVKKNKEENCTKETSKCEEHCNCNDHCTCEETCKCDENHKCSEDCNCHENTEEHCCTCNDEKAEEYLEIARKIQAEFDNYRKRSAVAFDTARENGMIDAVKVFLPAIDAFKKAKTMINDKSTLEGVEMVEKELYSSLEKLGVEPIKALGEKLNPKLHNVVAILKNENVDDDIIIEEYMQGFKTKDKVIRYSQVIVNKKGE